MIVWLDLQLPMQSVPITTNVDQWLATGQWFSPGTPVFSTNKTDYHNIAEILLKVALNTVESGIKHHKPNHLYNILFTLEVSNYSAVLKQELL
jgi:hypothetical protein